MKTEFEQSFNTVAARIHRCAVAHGWWDGGRNDGEALALVHSEISEMLEALREPEKADKHCPGFAAVEVEAADAIIRLMDLAFARKWDIAGALMAKIEVNETRPYKHGGKKF